MSRLQTKVNHAKVKDLRECNQILEHAKKTSEKGIYFSHKAARWEDAVVMTITDASFCNETILDDEGAEQPHVLNKATWLR